MIGIIEYSSGNFRSVSNALDHLRVPWCAVADPADVERATGLILPGVGNFGSMADALEQSGLWSVVRAWVDSDRPYLGICLGMQALYDGSDEARSKPGFGCLPGWAGRFPDHVISPHIGWNTVHAPSGAETYYFAHSFRVETSASAIGWTDHGGLFVSRVRCGRVEGVQFHPEKSGPAGVRLLADWCAHAY